MKHAALVLGVLAVLMVCIAGTASCVTRPGRDPPGPADERASAALQAMAEWYKSRPRMSAIVHLEHEFVFDNGESQHTISPPIRFAAERPNRFALLPLREEPLWMTIVSDGEKLSTSILSPDGRRRVSTRKPAAGFRSLAPDLSAGMSPSFGFERYVLSYLLSNDPIEGVITDRRFIEYLGIVDLDGEPCHLVREGSGKGYELVWIAAGDEPWLRCYVVGFAGFERDAAAKGEPVRKRSPLRRSELRFSNWRAEAAPEQFEFHAHPDAEHTSSLLEGLLPEEKPHPTLNQPAPAVELAVLGGDPVPLVDAATEGVLVLDFWATWCAPCIASMPDLIRIAEEFNGRGVRFYAVNLKQPDEDVRAFVARQGWNVRIAMDRDGSLARSLQVGAIPHTVVIDRKGIIRAVSVGARPESPDRLRRVLTELVGSPEEPTPTPP